MQKYVEIKRDGLTLRGMLHVPDNVSSKVPMVILLHGFCDDRNEINFVHNDEFKKEYEAIQPEMNEIRASVDARTSQEQ